MIVICTYALEKCGTFELLDVIKNHQFTLIRQEGKWESFKSMEQIIVEQELDESEKRYRTLISNIPGAVYICDKNWTMHFISDYIQKISGYPPLDFIGNKVRTFTSIIHPEDINMLEKNTINCLSKQIPLDVEYRLFHIDGSIHWIHCNIQPVFDKNNELQGYDGIIFDITDHKKAEQIQRATDIKLKERVKELTCLYGLSTFIGDPRISFQNFIYRTLNLIPPAWQFPEITKARIKYEDKIYESEGFRETDWKLSVCININDKPMVIEVYYLEDKPFLKEEHELTNEIAVRLKIIIEEKATRRELRQSEEKYHTLFKSSADGIASTDMEGKFLDANKAFLDMLGYSKEELMKLNFRDITPIKWHKLEEDMIISQLFKNDIIEAYEKEFIKRDGTIFPINIRFWIAKDEQGDPVRMWKIIRDITQQKQTEKKLKELTKLKSEFLRRASHELKTPLISIKGYSDLILTLYNEELSQDVILNLNEINQGCERLQNIINDLLHTSRLESPDLKPNAKPEDLSFLIRFCVNELNSLAAKREQSIILDIHDSLSVTFEKEEIHDVISNLLTNAIKYTPPKGRIKIKTKVQENFVITSVKDNGIGFSEDEKEKIFQQFGKIERYGQGFDLGINGTGLGLYISKKIVESHGGKIWIESEGKHKGSKFCYSLPILTEVIKNTIF